MAFDAKLTNLLSCDYNPETETDFEDGATESEILFGSIHVPVVSMLSPNLALIAGKLK